MYLFGITIFLSIMKCMSEEINEANENDAQLRKHKRYESLLGYNMIADDTKTQGSVNISCPVNCLCSTGVGVFKLKVNCTVKLSPIPENTTFLLLSSYNLDSFPRTYLSHLKQLKILVIFDGAIGHLLNGTFDGLDSLIELIFQSLGFQPDHDVFLPLVNLRYVDISYCEDLRFRGISQIFHGLRNTALEKIKTVRISRLEFILEGSTTCALNVTKVRSLDLSHNQISIIKPGFIRCLPHLQELILTRNYIVGTWGAMMEVLTHPQLASINLDTQIKPSEIGNVFPIQHHENIPYTEDCKWHIPLPPCLEMLSFSSFSRPISGVWNGGLCFDDNNSLEYIEGSRNVFYFGGPITGLDNLKYINLQDTQIRTTRANPFEHLQGLQILLLGGSDILVNFRNSTRLFGNLTNLVSLDLANIDLRWGIGSLLPSLSRVEKLNISNTGITYMNIRELRNLSFLNVSGNNIEDVNFLQQLDSIPKTKVVHIDITDNPLTINQKCCDILRFIQWTRSTSVNISFSRHELFTCIMDNVLLTFNSLTDKELDEKCFPKYVKINEIISLAIGAFLFVSVTVTTLCYRNRWKLKWCIFISRRYFKVKQKLFSKRQHFSYDAFVAYSVEDVRWVRNTLLRTLEEKYQMSLCVHHRDFTPGPPIEENIVVAMQQSRHVILVLSQHFLNSNWCQMEVQLAKINRDEKGYNAIIPILLESLDVTKTNATLRNMLQEDTYLEWKNGVEFDEFFNMLNHIMNVWQE